MLLQNFWILLTNFIVIFYNINFVSSQGQTDPNNCKSLGLPNCMICETTMYEGQNTCSLCKDNFAINYNYSSCIFNLNKCAQLDWENQCVICKCSTVLVQYIDDNKVEQKKMRQCVSILTPGVSHGCAIYQVSVSPPQQYVCILPHKDYTIKQTTQPYTLEPHNGTYCAEMSADGITCTKCHAGYQNIKGQSICYKGTKIIYNRTQAYFDSKDQKIKPIDATWYADENGVIPPIANCQFYSQITKDGPGTCESCQIGYIPSKDKKKCLIFGDALCVYGYEDSNGIVKCAVCKSPQLYYVDKISGNCTMRQLFKNLNCKILNPFSDQCMVCIDSNTQPNQYILLDGKCFDSNSNDLKSLQTLKCDYYSEKDKCQFCKENYILSLKYNQCVNQIEKCQIAYDEYNCSQCEVLYHLEKDENGFQRCFQNIDTKENCIESDGISDECIQCTNLYYIKKDSNNKNSCSKITDFSICQTSDGKQNICTQCVSPYYLNSGQCKMTTQNNCIQTDGKIDFCTTKNDVSHCLNLQGTTCTQCQQKYKQYLTDPQYCVSLKCLAYVSPSENTCQSCNAYEYLDKNNYCSPNSIPNCKVQQNETQCSTCENNYYLNSDQTGCIHLSANLQCLNGDGVINKCSACINFPAFYYLSQIKKCGSRTGCTAYDIQGQCTACGGPNYYLDNGFCRVLNCQIRNNVQDQCTTCIGGYYVDNNKTCVRIDKCKISNGLQNTCTECESLYYITNNKCLKIDSFNNCTKSDGIKNECTECKAGYYSQNLGQCNGSYNNCILVNQANNLCIQCQSGYYLNTSNDCSEVSQLHKNCKSTDGVSSDCKGCENSYYFDQNTKECVHYSITNCDQTDPTIQDCIKCNNLFYINKSPPKCKQVNLNQCLISDGILQTCTKCGQSFYEKEKYPDPTQIDQYPESYITCVTKSQITNFIEGCKRYVDTNTIESCLICEDGYYLIKNTNNTYGCKLRSFIQSQQCSIFSNSISSLSDSDNKDQCDTCSNGSLPKDVQCISITTDKQVANCLVYKRNSDQCDQCLQDGSGIQKYYLENNVCVDISAYNCKIYSNKICSLCADNYELTSNGQCIQIPIPNCKVTVKSQQVECQECVNQYYQAPNKLSCLHHDVVDNPKCILFSQTTQNLCLKCDNLYYLNSDGICVQLTIPNCEISTLNTNVCEKCKDNYILTGTKKNCLEDKNNSSCLQIQEEQLENPTCINCKLGYSKQTKKLQCANNINQFANCVEIDANQLCIKCESGYFLNSQSQCLKINSTCYLIGCGTYSTDSYFDQFRCEQCDTAKYFYNRGDGQCLFNSSPSTTPDKGDGTFLGDGDQNKIPNQTSDEKSSHLYLKISINIIMFVSLVII